MMVCKKCSTGFECTDWYHTHMYQIHGIENGDYEFDTFQTNERPVTPEHTQVQRKDSILPAFFNAIKRRLNFW
ncbi:hypothetical protein IWW50_000039 [Coemansia erecta]|nr:hypothetical protein GGF43_000162 [Coemansia sp. RSA 2618]KAJ2830818.1 hypothetical protein IWW50_000039 [Coemansia erecta]